MNLNITTGNPVFIRQWGRESFPFFFFFGGILAVLSLCFSESLVTPILVCNEGEFALKVRST